MQASKRIDNLECIAQAARFGGSIWTLTTSSKLEGVLREDFFVPYKSHGLRAGDRINVIASYGNGGEMEFGEMVVITAADRANPAIVRPR